MYVLSSSHFTCKPSWRMALLTFLAMALFLKLGFWQCDRAHEKEHMVTAMAAFAKRAPIIWQAGFVPPAQYQSIAIRGHYESKILLLDNQHQQHQFGYDVLTPFVLDGGRVILIDRGWVAGDVTRRIMPRVEIPRGVLSLVGRAYYPSEKSWVLGQALEKKRADLAIVERIDFPLISQFLQNPVYPFIIRLSPESASGYVRSWPVVAMSPARHYGYALQWFAIALVIFILFIALNVKKKL